MATVRCIVDGRNALGEGPSWDRGTGRLLWADISSAKIFRLDPASGAVETHDMPKRATTAVMRDDASALVSLEDGLAFYDFATRTLTRSVSIDAARDRTRLNDAKCDPQGRFWVGSMDEDESEALGDLHRVETDMSVTAMNLPVVISNALAWSPEGDVMYFADTPSKTILRYPFDGASGTLGAPEVFARVEGDGHPDGATVDARGRLWNAEWGGGRVTCYAPDGRVETRIDLPVSQPTCPAFGGPDMGTLYVTSARTGLDDAALEREPQAGGLFAVRPGAVGLPAVRFAG